MKLNKKAFTLIELLAVIVILAIIALIATPIVIDIISDTKESSMLRSAEFYLDGVEFSVASAKLNNRTIKDGVYNILENGNICLEDYDETTKECKDNDSNSDNNELEVEVNGEKPNRGVITVTNGEISGISLNLGNKDIVKNEKGELVYPKTFSEVCTAKTVATEGAYTPGDKYECKVKEEMEEEFENGYVFYVLSTQNAAGEIITETTTDKTVVSVNLIMDRNINSDGTPITKKILETDKDANGGIYNMVEWVSKTDYNDDTNYGSNGNNNKGPITAMNFLNKATSSWSNISNLNITYDDEGEHFTGFTLNGKARMPYKSEVSSYDSTNKTNAYLYDYLNSYNSIQTNTISGILGYWTLSPIAEDSYSAWYVDFYGYVDSSNVDTDGDYGVRPVINVKL